MSSETFLPPVLMPYLTPLFKTYVKDPASVRHHVQKPLISVFQVCSTHVCQGCPTDPVARGMWLARAKECFTINACHCSASAELKRVMFELPLEHFFDQ